MLALAARQARPRRDRRTATDPADTPPGPPGAASPLQSHDSPRPRADGHCSAQAAGHTPFPGVAARHGHVTLQRVDSRFASGLQASMAPEFFAGQRGFEGGIMELLGEEGVMDLSLAIVIVSVVIAVAVVAITFIAHPKG